MKIILVGAGISCLTFALEAIKDKNEVIIIDKNNKPGGVIQTLDIDGYRFLQGPLLVGDMNKGEDIYNILDSANIHLNTTRADRGLVLDDINLNREEVYKNKNYRRDYLIKKYPSERKGLIKYYKFYESMMKIRFLSMQKPNIFNKLKTVFEFIKVSKYKDLTAQELLDKLFKDDMLKAVYSGILADFCCSPDEFMGLGLPFINSETAFDDRIPIYKGKKQYYMAFNYVDGGTQKIVDSMANYIENNGGKILYNSVVSKINIDNHNKTTGVTLSTGDVIEGDIVVASGGAHEVFYDLVGSKYLNRDYLDLVDNIKLMESVFMVHLGLDINPLEYQKQSLVYYYYSYDLNRVINDLRNKKYHEGKDGYLIFIDSCQGDDFAPKGKYAMTIYTVCPAELDYEKDKEKYADELIKLAEDHIPNLSKHIVKKVISTPEHFKNLTNTKRHSFGGTVPANGALNPKHRTPIKGLYFVGSQSETNNGMGPCAMGGKKAYSYFKEDFIDGGKND